MRTGTETTSESIDNHRIKRPGILLARSCRMSQRWLDFGRVVVVVLNIDGTTVVMFPPHLA